jgi:hypothetical protein
MTCRNWTSSESGAGMVGHHDRMGLRDDEPSKNTSHPSRGPNGGCSQEALRQTDRYSNVPPRYNAQCVRASALTLGRA